MNRNRISNTLNQISMGSPLGRTLADATQYAMTKFDRAHQADTTNDHIGNPFEVAWQIFEFAGTAIEVDNFCTLEYPEYKNLSIPRAFSLGSRPYTEEDVKPIRTIRKLLFYRFQIEHKFVGNIIARLITQMGTEMPHSNTYRSSYMCVDTIIKAGERYRLPMDKFLTDAHKEILFRAKLYTS